MNTVSREFPSLKLLLPPLVPVMLLACLPLGQWLGHEWSAHGDGLLLGALFQLSAVVALVYELRILPKAMAVLRDPPANDTPFNWGCVLFAGLFCAACSLGLVYVIVFRH
jgi:hypothetical protein